MKFIDFEEFAIPEFLIYLVIASVLMLIGIDVGMGIGKLECKKKNTRKSTGKWELK